MRLLWLNLATDADDPILGFATRWIEAMAKRVEFIHVITMRAGRYELPENVRVYSVGKEKGYSEPRLALEFYRHLFRVLREDRCFEISPSFVGQSGNSRKFIRYRHDNKLVVLGQGIDTELFSTDYTEPDNPPMLLSVGRISPIKDPLTLIQAVHLLHEKGFDMRCVFVGDAPERDRAYAERVRCRVSELGLEKIIECGVCP